MSKKGKGKGKGPLAYISCKKISHAPLSHYCNLNPKKEKQIPNPECNQQQTNHHITEHNRNKINSKMLVNEINIEKEGDREMSKRREIFGMRWRTDLEKWGW